MAEMATIARPYAEALFEVSRADLEPTQAWLDALAAAAGDDALLQFAANPRVRPAQVFELVSGVLKEPLPSRGVNFLHAVIDNERLAALPEVARQFRRLANDVKERADVLIQSAFPIGDAELAELMATLEKRFGCQLVPTVQVEPALIGGVRVVVGDEVLDTSVQARLQQMRSALTA